VVRADEAADGDVVEEAGQDDLLAHPVLLGQSSALEHVIGGPEPILVEVEQRRLLRHARQPGVVPHEVGLPLVRRPRQGLPRIALSGGVDRRLDDDQAVQLLDGGVIGGLGAL
jgi:hypothetical protein